MFKRQRKEKNDRVLKHLYGRIGEAFRTVFARHRCSSKPNDHPPPHTRTQFSKAFCHIKTGGLSRRFSRNKGNLVFSLLVNMKPGFRTLNMTPFVNSVAIKANSALK